MKGSTAAASALVMVAALALAACGGEPDAPPAAAPSAPTPEASAPPASPATTPPAPAEPVAANDEPGFPPDQLDAMVAPIALYPDALLMQVLMASTYPTEVVMADRWRRDNASLEGTALDDALTEQEWDPSVSSLTFFPDVLHRMSENLEWTTDLGNAFLDQQDDVMDACQRMRRMAADAGTLQTTKEQTVIVEKETVRIEPANPEVVYVPQYNSTAAYGSSYQPPPQYYPAVQTGYTGTQMATTALLSFGVGMLTSYAIWGGCDWNDHHVYYHGSGHGGPKYVNKTNVNINNVNVGGNRGRPSWNHNPRHRRGVGYGTPRTRDRYARNDPRRTRFDDRRNRGYEGSPNRGNRDRPGAGPGQARPSRPATPGRPQAGGGQRPKMPERPQAGGGQRPKAQPATKKPAQTAKPATRQARKPVAGNGAFGGSGNAGIQRQASQRGAASRGRGGGGRGGGGGGGRGGGGKRRGGGRR